VFVNIMKSKKKVPLRTAAPGRPPHSRVGEIDRAILEAARALMLENGYGDTSMEAIATMAGVSKRTLYGRFAQKSAVFEAVVKDRQRVWFNSAAAMWRVRGTLEKRLLRFAIFSLDHLAESEMGAFSRLMLAEAIRFPELVRIFDRASFVIGHDLLASQLADADDIAAYRIANPRQAALIMIEMLWGWYSYQILRGVHPDSNTRRRAARERVAVFLRGIGNARRIGLDAAARKPG
jgi:TetR/AcrR family transcriptional regulator, mexJK operon transcriptional repressor